MTPPTPPTPLPKRAQQTQDAARLLGATLNPIVFTQSDKLGFVAYATTLSEFAWKNRLVGHTGGGLLSVDERVSKGMYYDFHPKLLPWSSVRELTIRRCWSIRGVLAAALMLFMAFCGFLSLWEGRFPAEAPLSLPFISLVVGLMFVTGVRRDEIIVTSHDRVSRWRSGPLEYKATLPSCEAARKLAESNLVAAAPSHA
jgi:hypothetical protein